MTLSELAYSGSQITGMHITVLDEADHLPMWRYFLGPEATRQLTRRDLEWHDGSVTVYRAPINHLDTVVNHQSGRDAIIAGTIPREIKTLPVLWWRTISDYRPREGSSTQDYKCLEADVYVNKEEWNGFISRNRNESTT